MTEFENIYHGTLDGHQVEIHASIGHKAVNPVAPGTPFAILGMPQVADVSEKQGNMPLYRGFNSLKAKECQK